jgi:hypothetical protein
MMPYVDTPLTGQIREVVSSAWGLDVGDAGERLFGGEESAAFRLGTEVVRIGPAWRTTAELEWCHGIAMAAAEEIPEAVPPLPNHAGATVIRVAGRPVSVWPYVDGSRVDDDDACQWAEAAELLARLHQVLGSQRGRIGSRPSPPGPSGTTPSWTDGSARSTPMLVGPNPSTAISTQATCSLEMATSSLCSIGTRPY